MLFAVSLNEAGRFVAKLLTGRSGESPESFNARGYGRTTTQATADLRSQLKRPADPRTVGPANQE